LAIRWMRWLTADSEMWRRRGDLALGVAVLVEEGPGLELEVSEGALWGVAWGGVRDRERGRMGEGARGRQGRGGGKCIPLYIGQKLKVFDVSA